MPNDVSEFFLCTWGDIQLFCSSLEWDAGNTQVVHEPAQGDEHPLSPRGKRHRKARAQLMFDDFEGQKETGIAAWRRFDATSTERRIFTHPADGSFFARIGDLTPTTDENSVMRATVEFLPDAPIVPVSPAGAGTTGTTGEIAVAAAADLMSTELAAMAIGFSPAAIKKMIPGNSIDVNIELAFNVDVAVSVKFSASANASASATASAKASASASASAKAKAEASALAFAGVYASAFAFANASAVAEASGMASASAFAFAYASAALDADVRASVGAWTEDDDVSIRRVIIDATRLSDSISQMMETGRLDQEVDLYPSWRSAIKLGESVRSAAIAATSETPRVFVMRVMSGGSLLALCARVYGGADAQSRARAVSSLNDVRTPGWLEPGDYLMPARPVSAISAVAVVG